MKIRSGENRFFHFVMVFNAILLVGMLAGCQRELQTGYGRPSGPRYKTSVNGTRLFHEMIKSKGFDIERYGKFSPRWERYQTVFWLPDTYRPPTDELILNVETWLSGGYHRRLVFVARDYNAAVTYWERLIQDSAGDFENLYDLKRQLHDEYTESAIWRQQTDLQDCDWYQIREYPYTRAQTVTGVLADMQTQTVDIRYGSLPQPGDVKETGTYGAYDVHVKLSVDERPFVYSLTKPEFGSSEILIVGNASFLLNLPLTDPGNQEIADSLVDTITENMYYGESVLFVENEYDLPIASRDNPEIQSQWSWVTQEPLRYIVPHVLVCCLLFCFAYYPIFGRPRKTKPPSAANFRDHIDAMGQLVKRTRSHSIPNQWIEEYKRRHSRKSKTDNH